MFELHTEQSPYFYLKSTWTCTSCAGLHILDLCFWVRKASGCIKMHCPAVEWMLIPCLFSLFPSSFVLFFRSSWCCFQGSSTPSPVLWPFSSCWFMQLWTWPASLWNGPLHLISGKHVSLTQHIHTHTHARTLTHTHTHTNITCHNEGLWSTPCDVTFYSTFSSQDKLLRFFIFHLCHCLYMCVRRWLFASWMLLWWQCTN